MSGGEEGEGGEKGVGLVGLVTDRRDLCSSEVTFAEETRGLEVAGAICPSNPSSVTVCMIHVYDLNV